MYTALFPRFPEASP